ncbi:MAG: tRNA uridine-5-carboxymethylaminomethyl(34) synthesis GTPase MnmE [Clostridia bacterium]
MYNGIILFLEKQMMHDTTIAAISTPPGTGGIAVIRMSGPRAFSIASEVFDQGRAFSTIGSHTVSYGRIVDKDGQTVDQVLVLKMKRPRTYTREDTVEIHCHGGPVASKTILGLLLVKGAEPAEPGEFTKRAFLNGRIDLSQAEAVMDLIQAETEKSEKAAVLQLEGKAGREIRKARDEIIELLSHINASIDYPEYDIEEISVGRTREKTKDIIGFLEKIVSNYRQGQILREGLNVAIYGPPNAGKSTLINLAAGEEKAIVTDKPGTTRDVIEVHTQLEGIPVVFHDTAGIRRTRNTIEKIGIEKTMKVLNKADVAVLVIDAKKGVDKETEHIIANIRKEHIVYVINKTDIADGNPVRERLRQMGVTDAVEACFIHEKGVAEIFKKILEPYRLGKIQIQEIHITNARHKNHIDKALRHLKNAEKAAGMGTYLDLLSVDLMNAADELGKITGETASEDVIRKIFEKFCVGK